MKWNIEDVQEFVITFKFVFSPKPPWQPLIQNIQYCATFEPVNMMQRKNSYVTQCTKSNTMEMYKSDVIQLKIT